MSEENPVAQEWRLRALARRRGWRLALRTPDAYAHSDRLWAVVDADGAFVAGSEQQGPGLTLDEIERVLAAS